jgi:hypothetical protein
MHWIVQTLGLALIAAAFVYVIWLKASGKLDDTKKTDKDMVIAAVAAVGGILLLVVGYRTPTQYDMNPGMSYYAPQCRYTLKP